MLDARSLRTRPHLTSLTALAVAAALVAGCGDDSGGRKLSSETAASLQGTLDQIEQDVTAGDCATAGQQVSALRDKIDSLSGVDRGLRRALSSSATRLQSLVADQCQATSAPEPQAPETGATGTTGQEAPSEQNGKNKDKKEKKPKHAGDVPPGQSEQPPPGQQGDGGGAGLPGESPQGGGN